MTKLSFGTKAETLQSLRSCISTAQISPLKIFTVAQWQAFPEQILSEIKTWSSQLLVVRSSCSVEDAHNESNAGKFTSVLGVESGDKMKLRGAIEAVIASYGSTGRDEQFFVQEQVLGVKCSGVVFTYDADTLAPYYTINYDTQSGSTTTVTSGSSSIKTFKRFRGSQLEVQDFNLKQVMECARELEELFDCDRLDIEFAIDQEQNIFLLQVRPIANCPEHVPSATLAPVLNRIAARIKDQNRIQPGLYGKRAIYSVMTDWNPAEMIGSKPRPLSLSLYKELITDSIWAYQRDNYGYKNLRGFPLLVSFMGLPYIDVRASFNSFVPKAIDELLAHKLVDYYSEQLCASPAEHDKVEFNIIFSCYYLDLPRKLKRLLNHGFSELELDRIKFALLSLTNRIISERDGLYKNDASKIKTLDKKFNQITQSDLPVLDKIYWLVEDCKRYGTLPFAGLARAGFVAVQMLKSFVACGIIGDDDFSRYMNSLNTVAKQLSTDCRELNSGVLDRETFLSRYGHLRPGTYDILSARYDQAFDTFFPGLTKTAPLEASEPFSFSAEQREKIGRSLVENGILVSVEEMLNFIKGAIEGREHSKFVFTRHLSETLRLVELLGAETGLSADDLSYIEISTLLQSYSKLCPEEIGDTLKRESCQNREAYRITSAINLPQLITDEHEIFDFHLGEVEPNFITRSRITDLVILEQDLPRLDLTGKIVMIERADPGYDWIFSRQIGGLVTMYGGMNSHMAIRCAELQIPAVIGCGEQHYRNWSSSKMLDIDCANRLVRSIE